MFIEQDGCSRRGAAQGLCAVPPALSSQDYQRGAVSRSPTDVAVLFTAQIGRKKPVWREGRIRIIRGSAVLVNAEGARLEATPADSLQKWLQQGGELCLERHKLLLEIEGEERADLQSEPEEPKRKAHCAPFRAPRSTPRLLHVAAGAAAAKAPAPMHATGLDGSPQQMDLWHRCAAAVEKVARREAEGLKRTDLWEAARHEEALMNKFRRIWRAEPGRGAGVEG
ncbi:unnamed protein product [Symbiodinium natans]|uniref:Uncharacterized protein n=1 Tax=Symbiodinium natans TaxID=878477 RepID=A0A812S9I0_9DINO|nr:unnamed protein product [Symbiodinium natans]